MNKSQLKSYAPQARKDFIAAVTARANLLGLSEQGGQLEVAPAQTQGDVTLIAGQAWPAKLMDQRDKLIARIRKEGFAQTLEAVAYTWFNRFAALRYMELHDYLAHGYRALSSREPGGLPEILAHATDLVQGGSAAALPGLQPALVTELKLAGNRDGELYRLLLVAQCNALSTAMPFLFERIDDETELLLPDNLLRTDSVIADLVNSIDEQDWQEVEIIGWLYQFYISEKKDQVIGKVVKSEDIPAATQLFTPNWIVQYLVQNSVGRLWLMANPQSTLASEWPYYITPAEQTPEVQAQLDAVIQTRVREDGDALNPESITVLDPACGSGHILVVAYDVLKAIYLERGYQPRSIPRLILEKNLYGLDIDDRAAQMAGFALLMKARAEDRRLFTATDEAGNLLPPKLNVLSLQESKGLNVDELSTHLAPFQVQRATIAALVETFEHAKTFGSLIQIPEALKTQLTLLPEILSLVRKDGDMYASTAADDLLPLVQQARLLAMQFDAVVANPPYMGKGQFNSALVDFSRRYYSDTRVDLIPMFIRRSLEFCRNSGHASLVTTQSWMFLSSYQAARVGFFSGHSLTTMVHLGAKAFSEISGEIVQTTAFVFAKQKFSRFESVVHRLVDGRSEDEKISALKLGALKYTLTAESLSSLDGWPFSYWLPQHLLELIEVSTKLADVAMIRAGMATGDAQRFVRFWPEVDWNCVGANCIDRESAAKSQKKWFPFNKGGSFRKWYGNLDWMVNFEADGLEIKESKIEALRAGLITENNSKCWNQEFYFQSAVSWSKVGTGDFSVRYSDPGSICSDASNGIFSQDERTRLLVAGFLNSVVADYLISAANPTLNVQVGNVASLPWSVGGIGAISEQVCSIVQRLLSLSREDWDLQEGSYGFAKNSLVAIAGAERTLAESWALWKVMAAERASVARGLEEENNVLFITAYGLKNELSPEVPETHITLARADREKDSQRLISYAIGCMMGRYSLDEPGLIYAHTGNAGFESGRYATFPADADGIVPITDELWFADDACARVREFLRAVWGTDTSEKNMAWLAESLGAKASETPDETIRRYLADKFFKGHLQSYKKRPIYWLFSSGKQGAFQALVYLHRYNEGTLARMRAEYVVPLTGKLQARIGMLTNDAKAATSTAARNKLNKEVEKLNKKHVELLAFDEKLRHYADMRISLDLDDGVKVNYAKFGDLLAEVKTVTGGSSDE